jgi:hypothetical protein
LFDCRELFVGIGFDQAGINGHALAADQAFFNAACNGRLEQMTQQFALAETAMAVFGKGRMIRGPVIQIEAAKPAIREVQMYLLP